MPGYKGHLCGGAVVGLLLLFLFSTYCPSHLVAFEWMICCFAGSLFPDIDVKSKGQHIFYWAALAILTVCILRKNIYALSICSLLAITPMLAKHRGLFHRGWFVMVVPLIAWGVLMQYAPEKAPHLLVHTLFFIGGALSHLFLDQGWRRTWRW